MTYAEVIKLYEAKDSYIDRNPNLTDDQKTEIKDFFKKYSNLENIIKDWYTARDKWEYEDFYNVMKPYLDKAKEKEENKRKKAERDKNVNDYFEQNKYGSYLTDEQQQALRALTRKAPQAIDDIDWDNAKNYRYKDFTDKFAPYQKDYILKKGKFSDLVEGEDYIKLGSDDAYNYYYVLTHKASRILGSNAVPPKMWWNFTRKDSYGREEAVGNHSWYRKHNLIFDYPYEENMSMKANEEGKRPFGYGGASWCIGMPHTDKHWVDYIIGRYGSADRFVYAIANRPKVAEKKVAVRLNHNNGYIAEAVSGFTDADINDPLNLNYYPSESRPAHQACKRKILDYLNNNELYRKLFVTHEIPDPLRVTKEEGTDLKEIFVNDKLVWKENQNSNEYN